MVGQLSLAFNDKSSKRYAGGEVEKPRGPSCLIEGWVK